MVRIRRLYDPYTRVSRITTVTARAACAISSSSPGRLVSSGALGLLLLTSVAFATTPGATPPVARPASDTVLAMKMAVYALAGNEAAFRSAAAEGIQGAYLSEENPPISVRIPSWVTSMWKVIPSG